MKHTKFLLVTLSLILVLVLASCNLIHQCNFGEEWKHDEENHWLECECGKQDKSGAHAFGEWVEGKTEKSRECEVCGYRETAPLEAHEHNYSDKWLKDGEYHWHACSGCNVPADKAAHEWSEGEVITPATEEAEGLKKFTCSVCEATKEESIPKLDHTHKFSDEWTSDETHHWHASTCGHEEIDGKEEHSWGEGVVDTPATEEADGLNIFTCTTCGATKEEAIPMLNHTHKFSDEWTYDETHHWHAATCIHTGEVDGKAEHDWNEGVETLAPTCSAVGVKTFTCATCGATKTEDIPKSAHTEEILSAVAPSCTTVGYTEGKKCSVCGETLVAQEEIAANGHSNSEEWLNDENNHWHVCGVCGEKDDLNAHSFDSGVIVDNKVVCTCSCGYTMENIWDGMSVSESLVGSGTEEDPYLVQSGADFAYIKQHMTAEGDNFAGVYFKMTRSIDLGNHSMKIGQYPGWNADRRFFAGIFDGNNCTVINLNMTESGMGGGLFSVLTGTVKNLTVHGTVKGDDKMVGGIVGWLFNGTLENCKGYVEVTSTGAAETGALVGTSENGKIINCVNYGSVVGVDSVGGIAGKASGTIENCVNNGTAYGCSNVGGIYGSQHSSGAPTLTNNTDNGTAEIKHALTHYEAKENTCEEAGNLEHYACSGCKKNFDAEGDVLGTVELAAKGHAWDDGVVAEGKITFTCGNCGATRVEDAKYTVTVNHLFLDGSVAVEAEAIEFAYQELATINAKTIEGYVANNDYIKVQVLDNVTVTIYYSELSEAWDGTSVTESLAALGGSGTADDPYIIDSGADLALIDQSMTVAGDNFKGVYFKMTKSIDLGGNPMNIGAYTTGWNNDRRFFTGIFDGNNCSVRNLDLDMTSSGHMGGGLFAVINGTAKNLSVYGTVKAVKNMSAGIVGWLYNGTLENCTNYVQVTSTAPESGAVVGTSEWGTIKNCVNYGSIVGTDSVGAIAGKASGTISGCRNYGTYEGTSNVGEIYGSAHNNNHPTVTD